MNDPMRLVDAGATDFERLLLTTAAEEEPSSELSARMLAGAVSAGAVVALLSGVRAAGEGIAVSGSSGASIAAAAATGAGGSIAPPAAAGLAGAWVIKWGVTLTLVAGAAVAGWTALAPGMRDSARAPAVVPARVTPQSNGALPAGEVVAADAPLLGSVDAAQAPSQEVARPPVPRAARAGARALGPEIDLLDSARRALEAGDAEGALGLIASYRRRFPAGALEQEATVLEMDALAAKGRSEQATELKEQFLAEHPESAHTQRVKRSGQTR